MQLEAVPRLYMFGGPKFQPIYNVGCHNLWMWRNKEEHEEQYQRSYHLGLHITQRLDEYGKVVCNHNVVLNDVKMKVMLRSDPPSENWAKLNTNGESRENEATSCSGIIRDMYGSVRVVSLKNCRL
ncbi:hypothetical protein KIW84_063335 [Lathyrus oleraceus]|uniref:Uncharacterized protein n=1 Tax=Pisum sativum TaxID=3888 RepID=A0A9D5A6N9_PEA|nr:hypothetical protein KIW84_063335 [Pisum sativum]